jgi:hypothetical protein
MEFFIFKDSKSDSRIYIGIKVDFEKLRRAYAYICYHFIDTSVEYRRLSDFTHMCGIRSYSTNNPVLIHADIFSH